jgi:hypothetical protein
MNWVAGWMLAVGTLVAGVATDPLAVYQHPVDEQGLTQFWLIVTAGLIAVGTAGYLLFAKPLVRIDDTRLVIVNPLRVWSVPFPAITAVNGIFPYPSIRSEGRRIFMVGMEESNLDLMRGGSGRISDLTATVGEDRSTEAATTAAEGVTYRWSIVDKTLTILLGGWLLYVLAAVARAVVAPWH